MYYNYRIYIYISKLTVQVISQDHPIDVHEITICATYKSTSHRATSHLQHLFMTGAAVPDGPVAMTTLTPHLSATTGQPRHAGATMAECETTRATKRTARCEFWSMKSIQIHLYWRLSRKILCHVEVMFFQGINLWSQSIERFSGGKTLRAAGHDVRLPAWYPDGPLK